jgi:hypothetical protein
MAQPEEQQKSNFNKSGFGDFDLPKWSCAANDLQSGTMLRAQDAFADQPCALRFFLAQHRVVAKA